LVGGAEADDRSGELHAGRFADSGARRRGISSGLLYAWRKALRQAHHALAAGFARVEVIDHDRSAAAAVPTLAP
jgi:hypothetical protein